MGGRRNVAADALDGASLDAALDGVEIAYYLVHSMAAGARFAELDRAAATTFREAAERAGVRRIIYLGGLQPDGEASPQLRSGRETGELLRAGAVPVTELRAGIVVGPGSAALEVIRDLVYHLPVMVTPRWVRSRSQPIALDDLIAYLVRLPEHEETAGQIYDAVGLETLTYEALMRQFARVASRPLLVARRGDRAGPAADTACRDEAAWFCRARVRRDARRGRRAYRDAGALPPRGHAGPALLVRRGAPRRPEPSTRRVAVLGGGLAGPLALRAVWSA